jgi:predicted XRE-type DNA-binding protein
MRPRGLRPAHDYSEFAEDDPEVVAARADVTAYANLIEGLVELRHRRRMTQTDVAEVMGTTQSVVSYFERLAWLGAGYRADPRRAAGRRTRSTHAGESAVSGRAERSALSSRCTAGTTLRRYRPSRTNEVPLSRNEYEMGTSA